jgi:hypothetical protein
MPTRDTLGGIVHSYQRYDPVRIPPPRLPLPRSRSSFKAARA